MDSMDTDQVMLIVTGGALILACIAAAVSLVATIFNPDPDKSWWPFFGLLALVLVGGFAFASFGGIADFGLFRIEPSS